jgi:hypothetical protein
VCDTGEKGVWVSRRRVGGALVTTSGEGAVSVYVSSSRKPLEMIQATVGEHAISSVDGRCVRCQVPGPCAQRKAALGELELWHQLPRRQAGATRPELIGARRIRPRP